MLRRLLTVMLLIPLSLNGLWMVCSEAEAAEPESNTPAAAEQAPQAAAETKSCAGSPMCPLHQSAQAPTQSTDQSDSLITAETRQESTGAICLLSPDGKGSSIAAIGFLYAPPSPVQSFETTERFCASPIEFSSITYDDASIPQATPPPRA